MGILVGAQATKATRGITGKQDMLKGARGVETGALDVGPNWTDVAGTSWKYCQQINLV